MNEAIIIACGLGILALGRDPLLILLTMWAMLFALAHACGAVRLVP